MKTLKNDKPKLSQRIDDKFTEKDICNIWKQKFSTVLNSIQDDEAQAEVTNTLGSLPHIPVEAVTAEEVWRAAGELSSAKAAGMDNIPAEFFKRAPVIVHEFMAKLYNSMLSHGCVYRLYYLMLNWYQYSRIL